ncbi:hypothetical protein like AT4G29090 [Hibiscus trionum]|uniref:Non-LTR retroelement reverse transcriptase n=1 Tax=Hibiscus trionum TaxID=183268 RepID=A0A9W7I0W0_HIBTR|nr:hypothetical protein like AT4G29090 [Hibiscus trionum]
MDIISQVLNEFCVSSGHKVSAAKTRVFFSKNTDSALRRVILDGLGFSEVSNLGKYLGIPLLHSRVTTATYEYLVEKVKSQLASWPARSLSFAGRVTLAKSILQAIPSYTMQASWLPKYICLEIEKLIRSFVWGSTSEHKSMHLVRWEEMQKPIDYGGLGFRKLENVNFAFLMKLGFQLLNDTDKLWVRILRAKYKWQDTLPSSIHRHNCSRLWAGISRVWEAVRQGMVWIVRDGRSVDFWYDVWIPDLGPLASFSVDSSPPASCVVAAMVNSVGRWNVDFLRLILPEDCVLRILTFIPPSDMLGPDRLGWKGEANFLFSVRSAYKSLSPQSEEPNVVWKYLWRCPVPQRIRSFLWLVFKGTLLTNEERVRRHMASNNCCDWCGRDVESVLHVLRDCTHASRVWLQLRSPDDWGDFWTQSCESWIQANITGKGVCGNDSWKVLFAVVCWKLWSRRNSRLFDCEWVEKVDFVDEARRFTQLILDCREERSRVVLNPVQSEGVVMHWSPPEPGWVKVNVDAARNITNGLATIGGAIRGDQGEWLVGFNRFLGRCDIVTAELWAIKEGIGYARYFGFNKVVIESDCAEAVRMVLGRVISNKENALLSDIKESLRGDWEVVLRHIDRSANTVADRIAAKSMDGDFVEELLTVEPADLRR